MKCSIDDVLVVVKQYDDDRVSVIAIKYKGREVKLPKRCLPIVIRNGVTAEELTEKLCKRSGTPMSNSIEEFIMLYYEEDSQLVTKLRR